METLLDTTSNIVGIVGAIISIIFAFLSLRKKRNPTNQYTANITNGNSYTTNETNNLEYTDQSINIINDNSHTANIIYQSNGAETKWYSTSLIFKLTLIPFAFAFLLQESQPTIITLIALIGSLAVLVVAFFRWKSMDVRHYVAFTFAAAIGTLFSKTAISIATFFACQQEPTNPLLANVTLALGLLLRFLALPVQIGAISYCLMKMIKHREYKTSIYSNYIFVAWLAILFLFGSGLIADYIIAYYFV